MYIKSLGYRTDLIFPRFEGKVIERQDYVVVRTPANPTFYWGNFVLFRSAPCIGDLENWKSVFSLEVASRQPTGHVALAWDTTDGDLGDIQPFLDDGFTVNNDVVLTAHQVHRPQKYNSAMEVLTLLDNKQWDTVLQNQLLVRDEERHEEVGYYVFKERRIEMHRRMIEAGLGIWYAAMINGQIVGGLGVFMDGTVGRFQSVHTHPEFRRLGICSTLVYVAAQHAMEWLGVKTLVMVADENYHAARIYESIGFKVCEHEVGIQKVPDISV